MTFVQGVCLPLNYLTAHFALITRGGLAAGETVLVHGAAGGVGTAVVQLAKAFGATVIAVVSTESKRIVAEELGADHVVLTEGFRDSVRTLDGVGGVDLVVDLVGRADLVLDSIRLLNTAGRVLVVGFAGGERSRRCSSTACCSITSTCAASRGGRTRGQTPVSCSGNGSS